MACGTNGNACIACGVNADGCANGQCRCGSGAACAVGQHCVGGSCTCDAISCNVGCCSGKSCVGGTSDAACGTGGGRCATCRSIQSCTGQQCLCADLVNQYYCPALDTCVAACSTDCPQAVGCVPSKTCVDTCSTQCSDPINGNNGSCTSGCSQHLCVAAPDGYCVAFCQDCGPQYVCQ
jgi:hypothetical protein